MKSVLMSIKPKYCELIASGKKTIEVRKTKPKINTPFKCYIYCTKKFYKKGDGYFQGKCYGKVIGEFVCGEIQEIEADNLVALYFNNPSNETCVTDLEMRRYSNGKNLFLWHISDLVIYDEPKELSEFMIIDKNKLSRCPYRERIYQNPEYCNGNYLLGGYSCSKVKEPDFDDIDFCKGRCPDVFKPLTRPPQSWCYVEDVKP